MTRNPKPPAWPRPLERDIQTQVAQLFRAAGFKVRSTSQTRPSEVALGLPDLRFHHLLRDGFAGDFETKRPAPSYIDADGQVHRYHPHRPVTHFPEGLRPAQLAFRHDAHRGGHFHFWGGVLEAQAALVVMGFARYINGTRFVIQLQAGGRPGVDATARESSDDLRVASDWLQFVNDQAPLVADQRRARKLRAPRFR